MRDKLHRGLWLFLAVLFIVTGLGVGVYSFLVSTHGSGSDNISCAHGAKVPNQQPGKDGKITGAQLAGFTPPVRIGYVYCTDYKLGTGKEVTASSKITVNYVGALAANGKIFDSSFDHGGQPFTTDLSSVIPGWAPALIGMKVGGFRRIFIPAQYGYGATGSLPTIPPNADLVFDIQLLAAQ